MSETVRLVSDGEELVLAVGEAFRVHPIPDAAGPAAARKVEPAPERVALQYVGFKDVEGRREYALNARRGDQTCRYVVWIDLAAFSARQALLQDGPDICYQKLMRELAEVELQASDGIGVTEGDLTAYRASHAPPARRTMSPRPPEAAKPSPGGGAA
jgi:hypothetical protein